MGLEFEVSFMSMPVARYSMYSSVQFLTFLKPLINSFQEVASQIIQYVVNYL